METTTLKTIGLLEMFGKGNTNFIGLSIKQYEWLISTADREKLTIHDGTGTTLICLPDMRIYKVKQGSYHVAGYGGTRGTRPSDRYSASVYFLLEFKTTGIRQMYRYDELQRLTHTSNGDGDGDGTGILDGHEYKIIPYESSNVAK